MAFKIYHSFTFDRKLDKMQKDFKDWLENIEAQLETNPYVGDQIRFRWFREKKRGKYRIYYLIYEDIQAVYLVNLSEVTISIIVMELLVHFTKTCIKNCISK